MEQQIHFCTTADGARIAYATVGHGPPLLKAANWLSHLEFDWRSPIWRHLLAEFARDHTFIRYDERGNGLSDWNLPDLSFDAWVQDLESVVEAAGVDRFPLLGISQGGAVAIAYAARHPERVSHLILYGAYARGWAKRESPEEIEQRQAALTLVRLGWGKDNPAFRQMWTTLYAPDATQEQAQSFNDLQRISTSPENAVRLMNEMGNIDIVDLLPQIKVPTLVLHCRDEAGVPFEEGRKLAGSIAGARFVPLDGRNHLLLEGDRSWGAFVKEVRGFLGTEVTSALTGGSDAGEPAKPNLKRTDLPERYTIISFLGVGGMGEVYLAEDKKLGRKVALKTLPAEFTDDKERLRRFQHEARAASALNHPNILTIHEVGAEGGANFIAAEYIDGETLRATIRRGRMKIDDALDVAQQTAFALTAAHGAGIVHRDIKPENIMVRRDGIVKVLDFGLAKLLEDHQREMIDPEADTRALVMTDPGKVLGTPQYMSPEQARGQELDARSDIWSLGVVLYEMIAGRAPFSGETKSHTVVALLESEPPPLATFAPDTPAELHRIVRKALTKDRDSRYQTARDLMIDLKSLRRDLDLQSEIERSTVPSVEGTSGSAAVSEPPTSRPASGQSIGETTQPGSSAEYLISKIKRHKAATIGIVMLMVAAVGIAAYKFLSQRVSSTPFQTIRISQLTTIGKVFLASISPDGKYIAYAVDDGDQQSLWVKQVAATSNVQLVQGAPGQYRGITFTPDGNFVDYVLWEQTKNTISVYQVSALGGAPRKLSDNVHTPITFSSDGKRFAFVRSNPNTGEYALMIANADGSEEQKLATRKLPDFYFLQGGPSWSPDGKTIACPAGSFAGGFHVNVVEVRLEDGAEKEVTSQNWLWIGQTKWLKNGRGLVMTAKDRLSGPEQIWEVSYPGGEAKQLTNDLNDYRSLSLNLDSSVMAAVQSVQISSTWIGPSADTSRTRQIAPGHYDRLAWTPAGRIIYASNESGNPDVWIMDADGTNHKQLTFDSHTDFEPVASPDGRYVVFISDRAGAFNVWRMNVDGSNLNQLTRGGGGESPYFSPDGKWVLYSDFGHAKMSLWKVPIDNGDPVQITDKPSWSPVVSPDGKLIACYYAADELGLQVKLAVIPFEGGPPVKVFDIISPAVRWTTDGRSLTYIVDRAGMSNIWKQALAGGRPAPLTDFKTDRIFWFDWSHDGKQLAFIRGAESSDVVLISDTK